MVRVYYNKLIRDLIPQKMESRGAAYDVRTIEDKEEFQHELLKKVREESLELSCVRGREEFLEEYADLMVVLDALCALEEFSEADVREAIEQNLKKKGDFSKRLFLKWSSDDHASSQAP